MQGQKSVYFWKSIKHMDGSIRGMRLAHNLAYKLLVYPISMNTDYFEVETDHAIARLFLEPSGWGEDYITLYEATDISLQEEWIATAHNNFSNVFSKAGENLYRRRGRRRRPWAVITRDKIIKSGRKITGGLLIKYVSHAGAEREKEHKVIAPGHGYIVPTSDSTYDSESGLWMPFHEGTGIPHATVEDEDDAVKMIAEYFSKNAGFDKRKARRLAKRWVSYFSRPERYDGDEFVGRVFDPGFGGGGRFIVVAGALQSDSGGDWAASRPAYGAPTSVGRVEYAPRQSAPRQRSGVGTGAALMA